MMALTLTLTLTPYLNLTHVQVLTQSTFLLQFNLGYQATSGPAPIRINGLAGYIVRSYAEIQQVQ